MEEDHFKTWAKNHKYRLNKDELGLYSSTHTQSAWEAWKERARLNDELVKQESNPKS